MKQNTLILKDAKQTICYGPIEDLEFERATEIKGKKVDPWAGEPVRYLSIGEAIEGLKKLEQLHKSVNDNTKLF